MLQNDQIRTYCTDPLLPRNSKGVFDVKDGDILQNNDFFKQKNRVQLCFFQDAFDVCNPIGSAKTKFKMVDVYMILLNLPPYLQSKLNNIKLVLLCREKHVGKFGWQSIIEILMKDLKYFESIGINIVINNEITNFKGSMVVMVGDNLESHQIGGFVENFSSTDYFCRFCENTSYEFSSNPFIRKQLRTIESYEQCASKALNTHKMVKGVKTNSALNCLEHYHVCTPGLPPCLAHDIFEGIAPYDMWLAINYFLKKKKIV